MSVAQRARLFLSEKAEHDRWFASCDWDWDWAWANVLLLDIVFFRPGCVLVVKQLSCWSCCCWCWTSWDLRGDVCPGSVRVGAGGIYLCVFFLFILSSDGNRVVWFPKVRRKDSTHLCCLLYYVFLWTENCVGLRVAGVSWFFLVAVVEMKRCVCVLKSGGPSCCVLLLCQSDVNGEEWRVPRLLISILPRRKNRASWFLHFIVSLYILSK